LSQRCQHVAALLFAVLDVQAPSCTDMPCRWMAPTQGKGLFPVFITPLADITFKKHVINKTVSAKPKRRLLPGLPSSGQSSKENFSQKVAKDGPNLLWNRYSGGKAAPLKNVSSISDMEDLHSKECLAICEGHLQQQTPLSVSERSQICGKTLGQSQNPEWVKERTGRLTASSFYKIVHCVKPDGIVKSILYPRKQVSLKAGDPRLYGLENEGTAVTMYKARMELYDKDIEVFETGLHVHDSYPFIAASPDRLVRDGNEVGLLEVKCPPSKAGQTVREACSDKTFCAEIVEGEPQLKRAHPYFYQVQGQLGVTKRPWCDFVLWTNHPKPEHSLSIERIYFDEAVWERILGGLVYFYKMAITPELLTRRIRRLGFLYTTGAGYVPFKKYTEGFYICEGQEEPLKLKLRRLK
ncbi:unnamed protein product, partial [Ixodes hexagonus]